MISLLLAATFPVILFLYFIYRKDTQKEPPKLLLKCFVWGILTAIPAIFIEGRLDLFNTFDSNFMDSFFTSFAVAALVEEGLKFFVLYSIIWNHKEFNQHFDGIVYAVFVSLGFAFIENVFYVFEHGMGTAILRSVLAVPGHGLDGVMMGYFFSLAKFSQGKNRRTFLSLSLIIPIIFHGLYDFLLFYMEGVGDNDAVILLVFALFIALMISIWKRSIRYIKSHHAKDMDQINAKNDNFWT